MANESEEKSTLNLASPIVQRVLRLRAHEQAQGIQHSPLTTRQQKRLQMMRELDKYSIPLDKDELEEGE